MLRSFLFLFLFFPLLAFGRVDLLEWRPVGYDYSILLPQIEGDSSGEAVERYLGMLEKNAELKPFATQLREAGRGAARPYSPARGPAVLGIANDPGDLDPKPARVQRVLGPLVERGASPMLAPVAVTGGLTEADAEDFRRLVSEQFDGLMAMGGDDIHPSLFGDPDPKKLSVGTNLSRDQEEYKLIKYYLERGRGFFSGMCRGHQMGGVASGCELVKDIRDYLGVDHPRFVDHGVVPNPGASGPLTREIFDGLDSITVMSNHHQFVLDPGKKNRKVKVTGIAQDQPGISEISEYSGRRGFSMQTHPELMPGTTVKERFYTMVYREMKRAADKRIKRNKPRATCAEWFSLAF